jgi:hypothetical protein
MEGKEWVFSNGLWSERDLMNARNFIKKTPSKKLEKNIIKIFEQHFRNL